MEAERVEGQDANGDAPGEVAHLAALERRLTLLEEAGGTRTGSRQEPLETRITLLEQRFSLLDEDVLALNERLDALEKSGPALQPAAPFTLPEFLAPPQAVAADPVRDEEAHDDIARLTTRLSEMESDLRSTVERVSILRASELVSVHEQSTTSTGADPQAVEELRRELSELRSAVEALVMALSLGLGRQAA